jgi:hypothetical protein
VNSLRSALKDYYPGALEAFGTDLSGPDWCWRPDISILVLALEAPSLPLRLIRFRT